MDGIVICGARRTPIGGLGGDLAEAPAAALGGAALAAALADARCPAGAVDGLIMGCVLPAGQGQAPARQAGFRAGLGQGTPAATVNKMCGSGMEAVALAADRIALGRARVMAAGGMESMSRAPYLLPAMRGGARLGHGRAVDSMFLDGLEDAYETGRLMGSFAEDCATAYQFGRAEQDAYASASLDRARAAQAEGRLAAEVTPVRVAGRKGEREVAADEQPARADPARIASMKPAFAPEGTITAANASSISDGAAALILAAGDAAADAGLAVRARIVGHAGHAQAPAEFATAPIPAARRLLEAIGWRSADVDLWEVNEAFAVVPMAFMRELGIGHDRVNVHGGACALGHPIGASGARIVVTLLNALEAQGARRGVAAICIGGGEGLALAVELA